jgi:hypothetical protein
MRMLVAVVAVVAGCSESPATLAQDPAPSALRSVSATVQVGVAVDAPAVPRHAAVPPADAPPAFDFVGDGVPIGFGDVKLGDPSATTRSGNGTFDGADAGYMAYAEDGAISQISVWIGSGNLGDKLARRFGAGKQTVWKGPASWLIQTQPPFDFSGMGAIHLVIVRPGEQHVCGHHDGFAGFLTGLQRAVAAADWPTVARSMTFPITTWNDIEGADDPIALPTAADFIAKAPSVFNFPLRSGTVVCDLDARTYHVIYGIARLSPAITVIRDNQQWRIVDVGHAPHDLH